MQWLSCVVVLTMAALGAADDLPWWKTATFYQIYPRSFKDSDGDGVGDIKGITEMADYFKEIGVDAIWLSPVYTSPMVDFGYDVANYTDIDPIFGTMDDFDAMIRKYKEIDVKVLLDFVPNHSSDQHPWFQKSLRREPGYEDFYVWVNASGYDDNGQPLIPNNWLSVWNTPTWSWSDQRQQFYLHKFLPQQPDLNYNNPDVVNNMTEVINFWLDKGVDGFRVDAVQHFVEESFEDDPAMPGTLGNTFWSQNHTHDMNTAGTHALLLSWADLVDRRVKQDGRPRAIFLEVYDSLNTTMSYYGRNEESLEFPFNFNMMFCSQATRPADIKQIVDDWMTNMPEGGVANWVVGNHDNHRIPYHFGAEMVDSVTLLTGVLKGIKFVYYGEELGMDDTFVRWDQTMDPAGKKAGKDHYLEFGASKDAGRSPMQWDSSVSAGFSTNKSTWLPVNPNYWWLNVDAQRKAEHSHLKVFQALTIARRDPVLQRGGMEVLVPDNDTLLVVRDFNASYYALVINMGSELRTYTSGNLFAAQGLDMDMTVVVGSVGSGLSAGTLLRRGSLAVSLRPKHAVLLRSSSSSSAPRLLASLTLLIWSMLHIFR